jgi:Galactose binding lectin domain
MFNTCAGITSIVTLLVGGTVLSATFSTSSNDYCLNESFNVSCDRNHVILVTSAWFGRMRPGRCISGDFNVGCVKDVKHLLDGVCSLRRSCNVSVRSFVDLHPCQRDFVSYLEARYTCIQGLHKKFIRATT